MSRRKIGPRGPRGRPAPSLVGQQLESRRDGDWVVRQVTGSASTKSYRCPGCQQLITPATPHLVVWPVEKALLSAAAIDERRHWHTPCWRRRQ